ncbi:hypothetical protein [Bradyrhizobium sp. UFLA05-112]
MNDLKCNDTLSRSTCCASSVEIEKMLGRKGLILITFAWAVEIVGVLTGFTTAVVTTYPNGELPTSLWSWLMVLPMAMVAIAELGRVPLTSVLFHRHKVMQVLAFVGIVFLAGLSFENWTFGFERIVEMRLKPVSAANLAFAQADAKLNDIKSRRDDVIDGDTKRRVELDNQLKDVEAQIQAENDRHSEEMVSGIPNRCKLVRERCVVPEQNKENQRHDNRIKPLGEQRDDLRKAQVNVINGDRNAIKQLDIEITEASRAVSEVRNARDEQISQNQIYRLAAMWYRISATDVSNEQFEFVRFWFSTFSALAVALAGSVAALVYYAKQRLPGESRLSRLVAKLLKARRAYYDRKRRPVYRDVPVEKEKIVYQDREVPVEKIVYRDGKEPPRIVEKEVVKWIDRIVLIPRWGIKAPFHVNSLIRDKKTNDTPDLSEMRKMRDAG